MVTTEMLLFSSTIRSKNVGECYLPFSALHWRQIRFYVYSVGHTDTGGVRTRRATDIFCLGV
jgi:hypothetical protein